MDDVTFENPTFDPDGPGEDNDFNLPNTAEIRSHLERKVWVWSDRGIPRLAVQTAGFGASFQADAHDIRHKWQKYRFRLFLSAILHIRRNGRRGWPRERQEMLWGGFSRSRGY